MKESLARVLSGISNLDEGPHERPVDRLHALASSQVEGFTRTARAAHLSSLGVSMIALKAANRPDELGRAVERLTVCLGWVRPTPTEAMALKVARQAVQESVIDFCPTCSGSGKIPDQSGIKGTQPMKECPECAGTGKRRYSNSERIAGLEIEPGELHKVNRYLSEALTYISLAEDEAVRSAKRLLERW